MSTRRHAQRRGRRHIATHSKLTGSVWGPTVLAISLCAAFVTTVFTGSNVAAPTQAHDESLDTVLAFLVPDECETMLLTELVIASTGVATGTSANELILGSADADVIDGRGGDDCIIGGANNDEIRGGTGADTIYGQAGEDRIEGDDDWIDAGNGLDTVYGGSGDDTIYGRGKPDTIFGGSGDDTIYGNNDGDTINGGDDQDECIGGKGIDVFVQCEVETQ